MGASSFEGLAQKAVRIARNDDGVRDKAREMCKLSTHSSGMTQVFGDPAAHLMAWRRFLVYAVEKSRARGVALDPACGPSSRKRELRPTRNRVLGMKTPPQ